MMSFEPGETTKNEKHPEPELEEKDKTPIQEMYYPRGVATAGDAPSGGSTNSDFEFGPETERAKNGHAEGDDGSE